MCSNMPKEVMHYAKGTYVLDDGVSPEDVARAIITGGRQKEPFHILDLDEASARIKHFKKMMPRVQIFYAMKANDYDMMLKLAVSQGLGFDCASVGEINKILQLRVNPLSIIYAMPTKTPEQMTYARKAGVQHTTFDTSYELDKIKKYWPNANLLIRIRVDGESKYKLGEKFGCDYHTEAVNLLEEAATLGLKVVGVAFHVGSVCSSDDSHVIGLSMAKALFEHEASAGRGMRIVDIGGGFFGDKADNINQVAQQINDSIDELFTKSSVQVIAEPGRYLCEPTMCLYSPITNIRTTFKDGVPVNMFYINDGLHGTLRYCENWHSVERFELNKSLQSNDGEELEEAIIWGPTCDSADRVMQDHPIRLPRCSPSDWLVFRVQGAYSFSFHGIFSCVETPRIRSVVSSKLWENLKGSPVFSETDFELNLDKSTPLLSTLPFSSNIDTQENLITPILLSS